MLLIKNATIVDGTVKAPYAADVLIKDGLISQIKNNIESKNTEIIDLNGCFLAPGFIDIHAHSELEVLRDNRLLNKVRQGITTDVSGNCGVGVFPRTDQKPFKDILGSYDGQWNWTDFSSYRENLKTDVNMLFLQNHSMLRICSIDGNPNRPASDSEIKTMCNLLEKSLDQGCIGFSSGLYYAPCIFAERKELIELLKVVKRHNAIFAVHHRCEGDNVIASLKEVIDIAKETGVKIEVSHLKAIGRKNQSKVDTMLSLIHSAREEGLDIAFDQYPYTFGSTSLNSLLPPSLLKLDPATMRKKLEELISNKTERLKVIKEIEEPEGWDSIIELCGFDDISVLELEHNSTFNGKTLSECAKEMNTDPYCALFSMLSKEEGSALMKDTTQTEENLIKIMQDPLMSFGTDALYAGSKMHPRSTQAAPHLLKHYVFEKKSLSVEQAVNRMTLKNAEKLGLNNIGRIEKSYKADLTAFDNKGNIKTVIINGKISYQA